MSGARHAGRVLDERYHLLTELPSVGRRPRFIAEDLHDGSQVELLMVPGARADDYAVRPRRFTPHARHWLAQVSRGPAFGTAEQRAMRRFAERVALTGVSMRTGAQLIFSGWDRQRGQAVRVVIEEAAQDGQRDSGAP